MNPIIEWLYIALLKILILIKKIFLYFWNMRFWYKLILILLVLASFDGLREWLFISILKLLAMILN